MGKSNLRYAAQVRQVRYTPYSDTMQVPLDWPPGRVIGKTEDRPMLDDLLTDVFTFLCFLQTEEVAPLRVRSLRPQTLARLNAQLLVPDQVQLSQTAHRGGPHGTTERETDRIRFIHFLCEAANLVALTGKLLQPTPRAAAWLKASPHERAAQLFDAAFPVQPDRAHDQLWRAYRLPGWRLVSPTHALAPLWDTLACVRRDEPLKLTTLLKLISLDEKNLREVIRYLDWFEAIEWRGHAAFELADEGARLLHRPDAPPAPPVAVPLPLKLTRAGKLMVPPDADWLTLYDVSQYAQLVSPQPRRIYQLDRDLVQRAIRRGEPLTRLVHLLEAATRRTLPGPIAQSLDAWAREVSRLSLRRVTLLETRDPSLLAQLSSERRTRQHIQRTLSPRAVVLREDRLPALVRRLERQGLAPRVEFQLPSPLGRRAGDEGSTRRKFDRQKFDAPTAAHLYLAVRLNHQMSEVLPSACRTPYSILLDLEKQLSPRDRDLAAQLADEAAERILHPPHSPLPLFLAGEGPGVGAASAETITSLQRAIEAGTPLTIVYYSPYRDEVTTRTIEPHRIEWHGKTPYLTSALRAGASVAYCQLDSDERTFRVDRIRSVVSG